MILGFIFGVVYTMGMIGLVTLTKKSDERAREAWKKWHGK